MLILNHETFEDFLEQHDGQAHLNGHAHLTLNRHLQVGVDKVIDDLVKTSTILAL